MTKDENQAIVDKKREAYLNNELSHSDYYLWLSDFFRSKSSRRNGIKYKIRVLYRKLFVF